MDVKCFDFLEILQRGGRVISDLKIFLQIFCIQRYWIFGYCPAPSDKDDPLSISANSSFCLTKEMKMRMRMRMVMMMMRLRKKRMVMLSEIANKATFYFGFCFPPRMRH